MRYNSMIFYFLLVFLLFIPFLTWFSLRGIRPKAHPKENWWKCSDTKIKPSSRGQVNYVWPGGINWCWKTKRKTPVAKNGFSLVFPSTNSLGQTMLTDSRMWRDQSFESERKRVRQRKGRSHTDSRFKLWIHMRESQNFQHSLCLVSSVGT